MEIIILFFLLTFKHAFVDLFVQSYHNQLRKIHYLGGWPHYTEHAVGTFIVALCITKLSMYFLVIGLCLIPFTMESSTDNTLGIPSLASPFKI